MLQWSIPPVFMYAKSNEAEDKLIMQYLEEVFADVYGDIQRGKIGTASAKKIMRDQTDAVQRATQTLKGMKNKKALPKQSYSLSPTKRANLEKMIDELGRKNIHLIANGKSIFIKTDDFTKDKAIYSEKGRSKKEINARIKAIPFFDDILRRSKYNWTDTNIEGVDKKAKNGVVAMHHFTSSYEGFVVDAVIRDKGSTQFLYEMKFIENKKSSKQSMTEKSASTAPNGDVWNGKTISQPQEKVKQSFSVSEEMDEAYLDAVEAGDMETAQRMVNEAAEKARAEEPSRGKSTVEWEKCGKAAPMSIPPPFSPCFLSFYPLLFLVALVKWEVL